RRGVGCLAGRAGRRGPRVGGVGRDGQVEAVAVVAADEVGDAQGGRVGGRGGGAADGDVHGPIPRLLAGGQESRTATQGVGGVLAGVAGGARLPLPAALVHGLYDVSSSAPLGGLVGGRRQHREHRVGSILVAPVGGRVGHGVSGGSGLGGVLGAEVDEAAVPVASHPSVKAGGSAKLSGRLAVELRSSVPVPAAALVVFSVAPEAAIHGDG